jgi:c(7)-type cytochrome triheme protein
MKKFLLILLIVSAVAITALAENKMPTDYGKVVITGISQKESLAPVVFDHWLHRAKYTCRLCHVDIGFALKAGTTGISATDNMKGMYCGVCHNGKMRDGDRTIFQSCSTDKADMGRCERCHSQGKKVKKDYDFAVFTSTFPKDKFGNGVNWEKAANDGFIKPLDYLESVSIKKPAQEIQQDFAIKPKSPGMAEIIFSHKKHVKWNGCEVCHPDIFAGGKRGMTKYSMKENNEGKFCGVCHTTVSFPLSDCDRCHAKPLK